MKEKVNKVISVEKGITFRGANGQYNSAVKVKTADGKVTVNAKRNECGGRRAGSNYAQDEKCLRVASAICEGKTLETAVFDTYAKHGIVSNTTRKTYRPETIGKPWGSEYAYMIGTHKGRKALMRMSIKAAHVTETWEPAYYVDGKVPCTILISVAESERAISPKGYVTTGTTSNRNECLTDWKKNK